MKIKMLSHQMGSPDGARTLLYAAGQEYDLGGSIRELDLAIVFLGMGCAEEIGAPKPAQAGRVPPVDTVAAREPAPVGRKGRR